jgi:Uma2 family endonuclease
MAALPKIYFTPNEYLAWERKQETKHEYWAGEVYAMAGASERHNLISLNFGAELRTQLRSRGCRVYPGDMRIRIPVTGLYTYADVTVVCGRPEFDDSELDTLLNPTLIVEVLSKSTESYDRGTKFQNYRSLASLTDYLLVAQDRPQIEHYARQGDNQWLLTEVTGLETSIALPSLGCTISLADVYDLVEFPPVDLRERNQATR